MKREIGNPASGEDIFVNFTDPFTLLRVIALDVLVSYKKCVKLIPYDSLVDAGQHLLCQCTVEVDVMFQEETSTRPECVASTIWDPWPLGTNTVSIDRLWSFGMVLLPALLDIT